MTTVAALEVGGTHVTAGVVELGEHPRVVRARRCPLDSHGSAEEIVATIVAAAEGIEPPAGPVGIAMPGPFDYAAGHGDFAGAGKFEGIVDYPLGSELARRLPGASRVRFLNDAHGFALGEGIVGAGRGCGRYMVLTIGTGIGAGFVEDGRLVMDDRVPPRGEYTAQQVDGRPTEDWISLRALRRRYAEAGGDPAWDVKEIARAALDGDARAREDFALGYGQLARITLPWLERFAPERIVIGGSIARSWSLVEDHFTSALRAAGAGVDVVPAQEPDDSPLVGAAAHAASG